MHDKSHFPEGDDLFSSTHAYKYSHQNGEEKTQ
jgi:hypothetical protein